MAMPAHEQREKNAREDEEVEWKEGREGRQGPWMEKEIVPSIKETHNHEPHQSRNEHYSNPEPR
ncbi:hypothetical protein CVT26_008455 [Gymnopilus dilepis]|uniref:Uncharacterized protein n=1 Tax=Gymnopilus dilepis TaxID=231916 RepID=A0A409XXH3_9AGAR|nr:hypothetical protein CVT26_008455 [Gymnopilus dilepis]